MGKLKQFAEEISVEMGYGGELNDLVLNRAQERLKINYTLSLIEKLKKEKEDNDKSRSE